jgi:hypothetical protein
MTINEEESEASSNLDQITTIKQDKFINQNLDDLD